jgi:hypothetical protein
VARITGGSAPASLKKAESTFNRQSPGSLFPGGAPKSAGKRFIASPVDGVGWAKFFQGTSEIRSVIAKQKKRFRLGALFFVPGYNSEKKSPGFFW